MLNFSNLTALLCTTFNNDSGLIPGKQVLQSLFRHCTQRKGLSMCAQVVWCLLA